MKKLPISEIIREANAHHVQETPATVWDRIEAGLPAADRPVAKVRQLQTRNRYMTIAASFLVLAIAGWWTLIGSHTTITEMAADTLQIEGSLELAPSRQTIFTTADYRGIVINEGTGGSERIRACVQC